MPKETIWGDPRGTSVAGTQVNVHVLWNRDRVVDLGVEPTREAHDEETPKGFYAELNRKQINDLIRVLRRARDQAYGRDE